MSDTSDAQIRIDQVTDEHAGELLTLRRAAFVTEAQAYEDPFIPPLTQTLGELRADMVAPGVITLGAWDGPRLVGSVRIEIEGSKATLGRLAVAPDRQGEGIGTQMMLAVAPLLPEGVEEIWVFTGKDSKQNLAMYQQQGYEHQYDQAAGDLTYAYLRRILGEVETADDAG
ncbi:acetyltransferase (GNAT) family protein [Flavimobilis soli]|jgi:ribosomal protein S18 acetylase RimI-like enzyme|uniref:Acetyltransferase (GNAT) family protein n=1 Tax=Flavimobilis soli TaxID=442709 RepID=A0A2A9EAY8_9MICO|nr:GNAT family N-acetyltransferase [Flavimobilis soli]PFG36237.1 acetyltransferase (GNAT) family protein [Flavimobilis soli]